MQNCVVKYERERENRIYYTFYNGNFFREKLIYVYLSCYYRRILSTLKLNRLTSNVKI